MTRTPIETIFATGATLYVVLHNPDGTVWNNVAQAWEAFNAGHWANYAVALAEQAGTGYYSAAYPAAIADNLLTTEAVYQQGGASPAVGDAPVGLTQSQGVNVMALAGVVTPADNLRASADAIAQGSAIAGTLTTTTATTNLTSAVVGAYVGAAVIWTSGALKGQRSNITSYNGAGTLGFGATTAAPSAGDTFIIV